MSREDDQKVMKAFELTRELQKELEGMTITEQIEYLEAKIERLVKVK